jgi:hypothetical protein
MISGFRSAGAQCVIVNGVLGPAGLKTGLLPDARVMICRLRASAGEIERRFIARHGRRDDTGGLPQEVRDEIRLMDQSGFAGACVDTTGVPAGDVPGLVRAACQDWPGFNGRLRSANGQFPSSLARLSAVAALITGPVGGCPRPVPVLPKCLSAGLTAAADSDRSRSRPPQTTQGTSG